MKCFWLLVVMGSALGVAHGGARAAEGATGARVSAEARLLEAMCAEGKGRACTALGLAGEGAAAFRRGCEAPEPDGEGCVQWARRVEVSEPGKALALYEERCSGEDPGACALGLALAARRPVKDLELEEWEELEERLREGLGEACEQAQDAAGCEKAARAGEAAKVAAAWRAGARARCEAWRPGDEGGEDAEACDAWLRVVARELAEGKSQVGADDAAWRVCSGQAARGWCADCPLERSLEGREPGEGDGCVAHGACLSCPCEEVQGADGTRCVDLGLLLLAQAPVQGLGRLDEACRYGVVCGPWARAAMPKCVRGEVATCAGALGSKGLRAAEAAEARGVCAAECMKASHEGCACAAVHIRKGGEGWTEALQAAQVLASDRELKAARAAAGKERHLEAAAAYRRVVRLGVDRARGLGGLGWSAFLLGRMDVARAATEAGLADKGAAPELRAMLLYNRGRIAEAEERWGDAVSDYEASLALRNSRAVEQRLKKVDARVAP